MRVALPSQDALDKYWAAKASGVTKIDLLQRLSGLTSRMQGEVEKGNWRIGKDCDAERRAVHLAMFRRLWFEGAGLHAAARHAGLCYTDASIEYRVMMEQRREQREPVISGTKPRHVTAEMQSDLWYIQQQQAFAAAMISAHPELFGGVELGA